MVNRQEIALSALSEIALELASERDLETLLQLVVRRAAELLEADAGGLYLYDPGRQELELVTLYNLSPDIQGLRLRLGEGLAGRVVQHGQPLIIEDYQRWEGRAEIYRSYPVGGAMGVPLHWQGRIIGSLHVHSLQAHRHFSGQDLALLELFASHAATAIGKARDLEDARDLRIRLLEIGRQILESQDIEVILKKVTQAIWEHSPFKLVALSLYRQPFKSQESQADPEINQVITVGLTPEQEARLRGAVSSGQGVPARAIMEKAVRIGQGYFVTPKELPQIVPAGVKGRLQGSRPGEWGPYDDLFFMLEHNGQLIGRLSLGDPSHGRVPAESELEPLEILVNLATIAIVKVKRDEELSRYRERLEGIHHVAQQLAQIEDLSQLCHQVLRTIHRYFAYEYGALILKESGESGTVLCIRAVESLLTGIKYHEGDCFPIGGQPGQGITSWVAETGQPVVSGEVHRDPRYIEGHPEVNSELAVPIHLGPEILGVLDIESRQANAFSSDDVKLLSTLASQLAVAISNISRRQRLQAALGEREYINHFLQGLNQAKDLNEMLELILRRGIELLTPKADAANFMLWNEKQGGFRAIAAVNRDLKVLQQVLLPREQMSQVVLDARQPILLTRSSQLHHPVLRGLREQFKQLPPASTLCVPIREADHLVAVLNINNLQEEGVFNEADAQLIWALVPEVELALARAQDQQRLRELASRDPLTGLYNRHYLDEIIKRESERARRYGHPLALLMIDLDDFYQVNDRLGHLAGDRVLVEIAALIQGEVRKADFVFRFGGDEFLVLMPETNGKAKRIIGRLQQAIITWNERSQLGFPLSLSMGLSSWQPARGGSFDEALSAADQRMYAQKNEHPQGRKR